MSDPITRLRDNISRVYLGNSGAIDRLIGCLIARGHALIEDVPGVGKTILASALARSVDCSFNRIQLTSDMLPSDVLGVTIFDRGNGKFAFRRGPIFANIVLADEINRTTPRTQTALLEAMNEARVSLDGEVYELGPPFMVLATQNPHDFEGTYLLPENQLDRFLMRISLGYPDASTEARMLDLRPSLTTLGDLQPVLTGPEIVELQRSVDQVRIDESLRDYMVSIAAATREHPEVQVGLSPRGTLALAQAARASARMAGRDYAVPDDVLDNVHAVCAHRVIAHTGAFEPEAAEAILDGCVQALVPPA